MTTSIPISDQAVRPSRVEIPQRDLDDLRSRLERTRWSHEVNGAGYGVPPVGLLAWLAQLLGEELDPDFVLTNVMTYWLTRTGSSAARLYYENAHADRATEPTTLPTGVAGFGGDFYGVRRFAERDHKNIVRWKTYDHGGHFAAHKVPDLYVSEVQAFFRAVGR